MSISRHLLAWMRATGRPEIARVLRRYFPTLDGELVGAALYRFTR